MMKGVYFIAIVFVTFENSPSFQIGEIYRRLENSEWANYNVSISIYSGYLSSPFAQRK